MRKLLWAVLLGCVMALIVAGCGGDDDDEGGGGDATKAPAATADAKGNVNWCIGKDTSGAYGAAIDLFKKENSAITVKWSSCPSRPTSSEPSWFSGCAPSRTSAMCSGWT